jgi:thymidylate synthase (FAD)
MKEVTLEEAREIIRRVLGYGHESVIEHASFTFFVEGISRSLTHQLVRHRIASYTQQSMRYADLRRSKEYFIRPKTISRDEELTKLFDATIAKCKETYDILRKTQTKIAITMNARELRHFFALRCCLRAQWEIRELANRILKICKNTAPSLFENAGPSCVGLGYCPEAQLACGELAKVLKMYKGFGKFILKTNSVLPEE